MARRASRVSVPTPLAGLARRIAKRQARIGIIGLGYVGLPLAVEFAKEGFPVTGIDVDTARIAGVTRGESYILDVSREDLRALRAAGRLHATTSYETLREQDAVIICVPTPLRKTREPDMSFIVAATQAIAGRIRKGQLIILESTTYPGTTEEVVLPALQEHGLKVGRDFCLAFSPERIDPGNLTYTTRTIPKVIGGVTPACTTLATALYGSIIRQTVPVSSSRAAEMVKLLENTFRAVNIGLVNEVALLCNRLGINVWEVIEAAKTKPFGFLPFYPGPGIGGHCLEGSESLVVRRHHHVDLLTFEELFRQLQAEPGHRLITRQGTTYIRPQGLEVLSFDLNRRRTHFQRLQWLTARPYHGPMIQLRTGDGRHLTVTDRHPMVVHNGVLGMKEARDLKQEDEAVIIHALPDGPQEVSLDLIEQCGRLSQAFLTRIRVMPQGFSWKTYRERLRPILRRYRKDPWEYYRRNSIPLAAYLEARALPDFPRLDHRQLLLTCGRGPSWTPFPAVIRLDESLCRLIGYYLSEGCLTDDTSLRVRFSFHREETSYIRDVESILQRLGLRYSEYHSKQFQTCCIKVSSLVFGLLLRDVLGCGVDSYSMRIPPRILGLSQPHREALLAGLLRGAAGVDATRGWHDCVKRGKRYRCRGNWVSLNSYSISSRLFQQAVLLLQGCGVPPPLRLAPRPLAVGSLRIPPHGRTERCHGLCPWGSTFKRRPNLLTVFGEPHLRRCAGWLDGEKRQRLLDAMAARVKRMPTKSFRLRDGYVTVPFREGTVLNGRRMVYSAEVERTHTFVTSYGIVVHNCIPSDPVYLAWKARVHGFEARFIELATQINGAMPEYVVEKLMGALNERRLPLKGSRILVLGLAYKKDVGDVRDSPAFDVIRLLKERGADVTYHDPFVPSVEACGERLASVPLIAARLRRCQGVVLLTNHSGVDYELILRHARLILDTRNQYGPLTPRPAHVIPL